MSLNNTTEVNAPMSEVDILDHTTYILVNTTHSKLLFDEANALERALECDEDASKANQKVVDSTKEVDLLTKNLYSDNVSGYTLVTNLRNLGFAVERMINHKISAFKATQQAIKLWDIANKLTARRIAEYKTNHKCDTVNSQLELTCVSVSSNNE